MPAPPPPPPPPPMPGRGAGGPPPPPMPGRAPGGKPPSGAGRGALLTDISKGMKLKKTTGVNDRSAPQVSKVSENTSAPPIGGAPPVPGMNRAPPPPSGLAPPVPGNRARSNSDTGGDGGGMVSAAPQLGGLFAGGMPKLRKAGGIKTGAESSSPYLSDPESSRGSAPTPPRAAAPKPPGAPPPLPTTRPPPNPSVAALRNNLRPASVTSTHSTSDIGSKPKPPLPGKKPPIPPPSSRKPSGIAPPPPASPARAPPVPGSAPPAPPPPPPSHTPSAPPPPPPPASVPSAPPPPPPPPSAPRAPSRSIPPPPPPPPNRQSSEDGDGDEYDPYRYTNSTPRAPSAPAPPAPKAPINGQASIAEQAARNAFGRPSPAAPPPPPPGSPPPSAPSVPAPPPPPSSPPSRPATQPSVRSMLDPSSYTLSNGSGVMGGSTSAGAGASSRGKIVPIHDLRWRFVDEAQFPKPREFTAGPKRYRAGRGSSVPLDLSAFE
ncbi:hypothetical protein DM02DRAFT_119207 [Periconia macrospinosa]|uniref:WH2 domain-containing protein n=1 Tax=Periconia macrospinosa TaxID=97972 RepID=A0A2V1DE63_9PLEO|nr:hypothetical protein DM02DRAFT_119207 [Periconia macrospinosa]